MNITVASTFRDAEPYLARYVDQAAALLLEAEARGYKLSFLWGEGDSIDDTAARLRNVLGPIDVVDVSVGNRYFPSTEDSPDRWANVAMFSNLLLAHVPDDTDVLLWVESDLIWSADDLLSLAERAPALGVVGAPMWMGDVFYDLWTVRKDGEAFHPPSGEGVVKVDSMAGALAIRADLVVPFPEDDACRGWTRAMGGVWLDTDLQVQHPC